MADTLTAPVSTELDRTMVLVQINVRCWSGLSTDAEATSEFTQTKQAERSAGAFRKVLIDGKELRALVNEGARCRRLVYDNALPWIGGAFILPVASMPALKARIDDQVAEFDKAVDGFVASYDRLRQEARKRLGSLYSEADYPPAENMREKFAINVYWQPVGATHPEQMRLVDDIAATVAESALKAQSDAIGQAKRDLGKRIREAVNGLAESLDNYEAKLGGDAKPILRAARVEVLDHLYDMVANTDLDGSGDNAELAEMIDKLRSHSVEDLRDEKAARDAVKAQCEAIRNRMAFWG